MKIDIDPEPTLDPDCSTCRHRAERHPSKRTEPNRPRVHGYVCMVLGRAIGEHGTYMQRKLGDNKGEFLCSSVWTWDVPCRKFDKKAGEWYPLDYDPSDD